MIWAAIATLAGAVVALGWRQSVIEARVEHQRNAVLTALREVSQVVADEVQPALGTVREEAARNTATSFYRAVARVEGTEPIQGR